MSLSFDSTLPYRRAPGQPDRLARPLLPVRLYHGTVALPPLLALVDSGADVSAFDVRVARHLGVDLATCWATAVGGIGGSLTAYACEIELEVVGRRFRAEVRFLPMVIALLGRHDVFMQFRFAFDQRAQTLFLAPY